MQKNYCEMVTNNLCLGCTGLAENDWIGKYKCKNYNELRKKVANGYRPSASMQEQKK